MSTPQKVESCYFWWSKKLEGVFFPFFFARLLWHDSGSWFLINLMAENPHDVPRDLQIGDRSFEVFISWAFLRKPKTWWVYLPSIELPDHQDYYEFTPGILRGLCDAEHLETLQVKLEDALHGMGSDTHQGAGGVWILKQSTYIRRSWRTTWHFFKDSPWLTWEAFVLRMPNRI